MEFNRYSCLTHFGRRHVSASRKTWIQEMRILHLGIKCFLSRIVLLTQRSHIFSWLPARGNNRRSDLLLKLLAQCAPHLEQKQREQIAEQTLEGIWKNITKDPSWKYHFLSETRPGQGLVYQANHEMWEIAPVASNQLVYQCSRCKSLTTLNLKGICPNYKCDGVLKPVDFQSETWRENHYRRLYQTIIPNSAICRRTHCPMVR